MPGGQGRDGRAGRARAEAGGARGPGLPRAGEVGGPCWGAPCSGGFAVPGLFLLLQAPRAAGLGAPRGDPSRRRRESPSELGPRRGSQLIPTGPSRGARTGGGGGADGARGTSEGMKTRPDATMRGSGVRESGRPGGTSARRPWRGRSYSGCSRWKDLGKNADRRVHRYRANRAEGTGTGCGNRA